MKKSFALALSLALTLALSACGAPAPEPSTPETPAAEPVELTVFAAASLTDTMDAIIDAYKAVAPEVTIVSTYDSSGTLLKQIENGADCDLFFSAAQKQMNALEESGSLLADTRRDLLENKVVLTVPAGNAAGVTSFDDLSEKLPTGTILLAMGNSDVPVGQYTQKIFAYYGLDESALASLGALTYGSNVKEVATQVSEGSVDCGIVYATDAASEKLDVVDSATAEMCGQVIYPAAVLAASAHPDEAKAFLDYLQGEEAVQIFESVGFSSLT